MAESVARFMIVEPLVNLVPITAGTNKVAFATKSSHRAYREVYREMMVQGGGKQEFFGVPASAFRKYRENTAV